MRVTIQTELGRRAFAGAVVAGSPRIVEVKGMDLDAAFAPAMLYVNNLDKPGFIGASALCSPTPGSISPPSTSAASAAGDDAIALIGIDQSPGEPLIGEDPRPAPRQGSAGADVLRPVSFSEEGPGR